MSMITDGASNDYTHKKCVRKIIELIKTEDELATLQERISRTKEKSHRFLDSAELAGVKAKLTELEDEKASLSSWLRSQERDYLIIIEKFPKLKIYRAYKTHKGIIFFCLFALFAVAFTY